MCVHTAFYPKVLFTAQCTASGDIISYAKLHNKLHNVMYTFGNSV